MTATPTSAPEHTGTENSNAQGSGSATPTRRMQVGDLARRVTRRRTELGLSTVELAQRAGVDAWFLAYFEESADTALGGGALLRLAAALDTTPFALKGGEVDRPPGTGRAGPHPVLQILTPEQCEEHLAAGGIGRIVLAVGSGPVAFPVNFIFTNGAVVFRTSDAMTANITGVVAFEVDHIDEAMSEGWSVLVRGRARLIDNSDEHRAITSFDVEPWAGGDRLNLIVIEPFEMTGRDIVQRQSPEPQ